MVTRPNSDRTTRYISEWAGKVIEMAESKGFGVLDLKGKRANRKEFESMLKKHTPSFIFLNGHGDNEAVTGQNEEVLVQAGVNEKLLRATVVYALACSSGAVLGPKSVESGARAFIGYRKKFIFFYNPSQRTQPFTDTLARYFLEPSNQVAVSLLKGHNAKTAYENSQRAFQRNIQKLIVSKATGSESAAIRFLYSNMQYQVCLGDGNATA